MFFVYTTNKLYAYLYIYNYTCPAQQLESYTKKKIQSLKRSICIHEGFTQAHIPQPPYMKHNISKTSCSYLMWSCSSSGGIHRYIQILTRKFIGEKTVAFQVFHIGAIYSFMHIDTDRQYFATKFAMILSWIIKMYSRQSNQQT